MSSPVRLGIIGYGVRARHMAQLMCSQPYPARIAAIADPQAETISNEAGARTARTARGRGVLRLRRRDARPSAPLDGVIIGTRCSLHAAMAVKVMQRGIAVFLEKPVATSLRDLQAMAAVGHGARGGLVPTAVVRPGAARQGDSGIRPHRRRAACPGRLRRALRRRLLPDLVPRRSRDRRHVPAKGQPRFRLRQLSARASRASTPCR